MDNIFAFWDVVDIKANFLVKMLGAFLAFVFGGFNIMILYFILSFVLDIISGLLKAWRLKKFKRATFFVGTTQKAIAYVILLILANIVDGVWSTTLREKVLYILIGVDVCSTLENLVSCNFKGIERCRRIIVWPLVKLVNEIKRFLEESSLGGKND